MGSTFLYFGGIFQLVFFFCFMCFSSDSTKSDIWRSEKNILPPFYGKSTLEESTIHLTESKRKTIGKIGVQLTTFDSLTSLTINITSVKMVKKNKPTL